MQITSRTSEVDVRVLNENAALTMDLVELFAGFLAEGIEPLVKTINSIIDFRELLEELPDVSLCGWGVIVLHRKGGMERIIRPPAGGRQIQTINFISSSSMKWFHVSTNSLEMLRYDGNWSQSFDSS